MKLLPKTEHRSFVPLAVCLMLTLAGYVALSPTPAWAGEDDVRRQIDALFTEYDAWDRPGIALAVVRDGELFYARGYGSANLEYDIPVTPATVFHVASVSKQFTCFAVLLLAEEGKLALDDDIHQHIADLPDFGHPITLRQLMHHTSGLRDQWALLAMAGWRLDDVITRNQIMRIVRRQRELNFTPGDEHLYCNTGYTLLAEVVANVSGKSFPDFTMERIFKPLGMAHTHFHDDHELIVPNRAYSYAKREGGGYRKSVLSYANVGATSLFTTAEDLARWLTNLDTGQVGGQHVIEQMHTRGVLTGGKKIDYALGLSIGKYRGLKTVGHGGADAGFRSHVVRFPDSKLGIVVLANLAEADTQAEAMKVAQVMLGDELKSDSKPKESDNEKEAEKKLPIVEVPVETLQRYVGTYKLNNGGTTEIKLHGERLVGKLPASKEMDLIPLSQREFLVKEIQARVTFPESDAGQAPSFTAKAGAMKIEATRLEAPKPEELNQYAGKYISGELATAYEIVVEDDRLVARHQRHDDIPLTPAGGDEFAGGTWFFQGLKFQRDTEGNITGVLVSNGRVRNLRFDRAGVADAEAAENPQ